MISDFLSTKELEDIDKILEKELGHFRMRRGFNKADLDFIERHLVKYGFVSMITTERQSKFKIKFYEKCVLHLSLDGTIRIMTKKYYDSMKK